MCLHCHYGFCCLCRPPKYTSYVSAVRLQQEAKNKITYDLVILPLCIYVDKKQIKY